MTTIFSFNLLRMAMAVLRPTPAKCCGRHRSQPGFRCFNCPVKRSAGLAKPIRSAE